MVPPARPAPTEGRSSWLVIAAIVLLTLLAPFWIAFGGRSPGKVQGSLSETPAVLLQAGQRRTFAPGRMDEGTTLACQNNGLTVTAAVPSAGKTAVAHQDAAYGYGATIRIRHLADDRVTVRCTT